MVATTGAPQRFLAPPARALQSTPLALDLKSRGALEALHPLSPPLREIPDTVWPQAQGRFAVQFFIAKRQTEVQLRVNFLRGGDTSRDRTFHLDIWLRETHLPTGQFIAQGEFRGFDLGCITHLPGSRINFKPLAALAGPEGKAFTQSHVRDFRNAWTLNAYHHFEKCFCQKQDPQSADHLGITTVTHKQPFKKTARTFSTLPQEKSCLPRVFDFLWRYFAHVADEVQNGKVEQFIQTRLIRYRFPQRPKASPQ